MNIVSRLCFIASCLTGVLFVPVAASAQEMTAQPGTNMAAMKFTMVPPLPTCATGAVVNGDPSKGASFILAKARTGCTIPWHWHTPNEHLMMVSGAASLQMKNAKPLTLRAGGFALMPSKHVHQFKCLSACTLYIYSDTGFDIHYVNQQGNEISPTDALKPLRQKPATEMK
jgi:quercetin dioxygenase-like cupin family protein